MFFSLFFFISCTPYLVDTKLGTMKLLNISSEKASKFIQRFNQSISCPIFEVIHLSSNSQEVVKKDWPLIIPLLLAQRPWRQSPFLEWFCKSAVF